MFRQSRPRCGFGFENQLREREFTECKRGAHALRKEMDSGQTTDINYRELHKPRERTKA